MPREWLPPNRVPGSSNFACRVVSEQRSAFDILSANVRFPPASATTDPLRTLVCLLGSWGELLYQVQIPRRPGNSQFSGSADRVPADLASRFSTGFAAAVCAKAVVTGLVDLGVPRFDFPLDWLRLLEGLRHRRYAQARSSSQTRRYITPNVRFPPVSATALISQSDGPSRSNPANVHLLSLTD